MSETDKLGFWPKNIDELTEYINNKLSENHDYGSSAEALTDVTVATFNYAASNMGVTGFQASWSSLQVLGILRGLDGPFGILDGSLLLYPQYDLENQTQEWIAEWRPQLADKARELLKKWSDVNPRVKARWEEIAALNEPPS